MSRKIQLFCVPYAGGPADSFRELAGILERKGINAGRSNSEDKGEEAGRNNLEYYGEEVENVEIQVIPLEYAGHGTRKTELFYPGFDEMAADAARQIREKRESGCAYALLGYSMGSIVTYEMLAQELLEDLPCHIFVAAHEAPDIHWDCKTYEQLDDEAFMDRMISFGGFPNFDRKLMQNKFFRKLYFQPIREDYRLLSVYRMKKQITLPAPATMIYSPQDIPTERIRSWDKFAAGEMEYVELGRNHFFLKEHAEELAQILYERICEK